MGRGASLHTTPAALLLLLQLATPLAAVRQVLLVSCELQYVMQAPVHDCCAGLKAKGGLEDTALLCCRWCLQLQTLSWWACSILGSSEKAKSASVCGCTREKAGVLEVDKL